MRLRKAGARTGFGRELVVAIWPSCCSASRCGHRGQAKSFVDIQGEVPAAP